MESPQSFASERAEMNLTNAQQIHRDYLKSPLWQSKRLEALSFYGPTCNRCGKEGTDVHHKTYERTGGNERMEDFEVLCRACHEAHHRVERATNARGGKRRNRSINRSALARYLTQSQRQILQARFRLMWGPIYIAIISGNRPDIEAVALAMLGKKHAHSSKRRGQDARLRYGQRPAQSLRI